MNGELPVLSGFRGRVERNASLGDKTTWRVGGQAELLAVPQDLDDLLYLLAATHSQSLAPVVLGRGSNVLIDDEGIPGVTIQLGKAFRYLVDEGEFLRVGAGVPMPALAKRVATMGYAGYEHLIGIPGTVGAGIVMNAGTGTTDAKDMRGILGSVTYVTPDLRLLTCGVCELDLGYRSSRLQGDLNIVVEARFCLSCAQDATRIDARHRAILSERRAKFPLNKPSAGSVFKRPRNAPPAGWLIDTAGLKGLRIGDAQVSPVHANFIVNLGSATSREIKDLIDVVRARVVKAHGVVLEREVIYLPEQRSARK